MKLNMNLLIIYEITSIIWVVFHPFNTAHETATAMLALQPIYVAICYLVKS